MYLSLYKTKHNLSCYCKKKEGLSKDLVILCHKIIIYEHFISTCNFCVFLYSYYIISLYRYYS